MLVATPYNITDFDERPPRVVAGIKKTLYGGCDPYSDRFRPKLTGDILVKSAADLKWCPRKACIRSGQLWVSGGGEWAPLRVPLRHLSLEAGPLPNSLSLCRGASVIVTLQTANEETFDLWAKTIAIELIRQTPLEAVKYLDIFTLANCWKRPHKDPDDGYQDYNVNNNKTPAEINCELCCTNNSSKTVEESEERTVETLLKKCQNAESYVPVKEKLILFESLCKLGRKVRSSEDVSSHWRQIPDESSKRARSLHDLTNLKKQKAVREICKYFEVKSDLNSKCNKNYQIISNLKVLKTSQ